MKNAWRSRLRAGGSAAVVIVLALLATPWLIGPACPRHVVIATGGSEGAYYAFAQRYREILARDGIELEVRSTAGSIENFGLLDAENSEVSLALIQGGIGTTHTSPRIESLASLYLEPVWVFHRGDIPITRLTQLQGKRIAVGSEGSGTRAVALQLLQETGSVESGTRLEPISGRNAVDALKTGDVDAAFFVISPTSPLVLELLESDGIHLMNFARAEAFRRRFPFLATVTLSEGMLDLDQNLPGGDITLLAPTANLVARKDLHSALVPLLLQAAAEVHEPGGFLEEPGEFPSDRHVDFAMNADAARFFKSGPSFFYKYLPFRVAVLLDRLKLVLLPLCTLLFPFVKAAPPIYRWRIRSTIYRWYRVLREVDQKLKESDGRADFSAEINRLQALETELAEVSVPLSYMQEFYNLRLHVSFVLGRLREWNEPATVKTPPVRVAA